MQSQSGCAGLRLHERATGAVHGDAVEGLIEGREQSGDGEFTALAKTVQSPRAVFAAAPGEKKLVTHPTSVSQAAVQRGAASAA